MEKFNLYHLVYYGWVLPQNVSVKNWEYKSPVQLNQCIQWTHMGDTWDHGNWPCSLISIHSTKGPKWKPLGAGKGFLSGDSNYHFSREPLQSLLQLPGNPGTKPTGSSWPVWRLGVHGDTFQGLPHGTVSAIHMEKGLGRARVWWALAKQRMDEITNGWRFGTGTASAILIFLYLFVCGTHMSHWPTPKKNIILGHRCTTCGLLSQTQLTFHIW